MSGPNVKYKHDKVHGVESIIKDGHTMHWGDVVADLHRLSYLEGRLLEFESGGIIDGMKCACIGEFDIEKELYCNCSGEDGDGHDPDCDICEGSGDYVQPFTVDWSTTKDIYKAMNDAKVRLIRSRDE